NGFDGLGAVMRGVEGEAAEVAAKVEDAAPLRVRAYKLPVFDLIEKHSGLLPVEDIDGEFQTVEVDGNGLGEISGEDGLLLRQALVISGGGITSFNDGAGGEFFLQQGDDVVAALIDCERQELDAQDVFVAI